MGAYLEPWPVTQQESPQTGASTPASRPETTPDLSGWTGTRTEWVEKPSDQESCSEATWEDPQSKGSSQPLAPGGACRVWIIVLGGSSWLFHPVLLRPRVPAWLCWVVWVIIVYRAIPLYDFCSIMCSSLF